MVKIRETSETVGPAMMDNSHEEPQVGASAGVCNWSRKPTIAAAERISGGGERHPASASAGSVAPVGSAEIDARRNWLARENPGLGLRSDFRSFGEPRPHCLGSESGIFPRRALVANKAKLLRENLEPVAIHPWKTESWSAERYSFCVYF